MATRSFLFDSTGSDRIITASDMARMFGTIAKDGYVKDEQGELEVLERVPAIMGVRVSLGAAYVRGRFFEIFDLPENKTIATADGTNDRIDRVVVRLDLTARVITVEVLTGTPAATPTAPALTRTSSIWELSLAQVLVQASVTSISNTDITDERDDTSVMGVSNFPSALSTLGGTMEANAVFTNNVGVQGTRTTGQIEDMLKINNFNNVQVGTGNRPLLFLSSVDPQYFDGSIFIDVHSDNNMKTMRASRALTVQSIPDNIFTAVQFDTVNFQSQTFVDLGVSTTDITIQEDGIYQISAHISFVVNNTGVRQIKISRISPSSLTIIQNNQNATVDLATRLNVTATISLDAGDILNLEVVQNSGGALDLEALSHSNWISLTKIRNKITS